jgi:guanylate kinase
LSINSSRLIVLDGPSSVGKSTIAARLTNVPELNLAFVKRYTTREPRPGDLEEGNYIFVSRSAFTEMERRREFVEVRHFQFGMSYGLPFSEIERVLASGRNALAIISLGNAEKIRRHYNNAITVLITAPLRTIELRLRNRGLDESKIEERLANASKAAEFSPHYDYVVVNDEGKLDEVLSSLSGLLKERLDNGRS